MMDQKTLKSLIKLMIDNGLVELDLADGDEKVRLKRGGGEPIIQYVPAAMANGSAAAPASAAPQTDAAGEELLAIPSPMVGTFYAASNPDAQPLVDIGQRVEAESVVCIIEAMKVFNEIKADVDGTIEKILVENGQAVEFDQPLFLVRPG